MNTFLAFYQNLGPALTLLVIGWALTKVGSQEVAVAVAEDATV